MEATAKGAEAGAATGANGKDVEILLKEATINGGHRMALRHHHPAGEEAEAEGHDNAPPKMTEKSGTTCAAASTNTRKNMLDHVVLEVGSARKKIRKVRASN